MTANIIGIACLVVAFALFSLMVAYVRGGSKDE